MSPVLALVFYAALVHLLGLGILRAVLGQRDDAGLAARIGFAGALGMGAVTLATYIGYLAGAPAHPIFSLALLPVAWIAARLRGGPIPPWRPVCPAFRRRVTDVPPPQDGVATQFHGRTPPVSRPRIRWWQALLGIAIAAETVYLFLATFWRPVNRQDDWVQWAANAKLLWYHGLPDATYFAEATHSNYPLFLHANELLYAGLLTRWDEFGCKSFLVILLLDFALALYGFLHRRYGRNLALVFTFLTITTPHFGRVGLDGTAEIPAALVLGFATMAFLYSREGVRTGWITLSALLAGILCAVKSETFAPAAVLAAVTALTVWRRAGDEHRAPFRNRISIIAKPLALYAISTALLVLPWVALMHRGECGKTRLLVLRTDDRERGLARMVDWMDDPESYRAVAADVVHYLLPIDDGELRKGTFLWGPYLLAGLAFWLIRRRGDRESQHLALLLAGTAVIYAAGSLATEEAAQYRRLLTHAAGVVILFVARQAALAYGADAGADATRDAERGCDEAGPAAPSHG